MHEFGEPNRENFVILELPNDQRIVIGSSLEFFQDKVADINFVSQGTIATQNPETESPTTLTFENESSSLATSVLGTVSTLSTFSTMAVSTLAGITQEAVSSTSMVSSSPESPEEKSDGESLSNAEIAGIVIGVVAVVGSALYYLRKSLQKDNTRGVEISGIDELGVGLIGDGDGIQYDVPQDNSSERETRFSSEQGDDISLSSNSDGEVLDLSDIDLDAKTPNSSLRSSPVAAHSISSNEKLNSRS